MTISLSSLAPGVLVGTPAAQVSLLEPRGRLSLRARDGLDALEKALGFALPDRIGKRTDKDGVEAIRLGPDEWTLLAPLDKVAGLVAAFAAVYADHSHSLVDISDREVSFGIEGPRAAELLTLGCPRDIDSIAVGDGRRTLCDIATVVLWRDGENAFRVDVWNSFASHLYGLFETGCAELAAEAV